MTCLVWLAQMSGGTLAACPEAVASFLEDLAAGLRPLVRKQATFLSSVACCT